MKNILNRHVLFIVNAIHFYYIIRRISLTKNRNYWQNSNIRGEERP